MLVVSSAMVGNASVSAGLDETTPPRTDPAPADTTTAVPVADPAAPTESDASDGDGSLWIWLVIAGGAAIGILALVGLATAVGRRRANAAWREDAAHLVQEGLVIVDLASPDPRGGSPCSYGRETLMAIEERLDRLMHRAAPIRQNAPTLRAREHVENVSQSAAAFASAVMADRAIRDGVTVQTANQRNYSTQRVVERMHEFDLNLRGLSWLLQELP